MECTFVIDEYAIQGAFIGASYLLVCLLAVVQYHKRKARVHLYIGFSTFISFASCLIFLIENPMQDCLPPDVMMLLKILAKYLEVDAYGVYIWLVVSRIRIMEPIYPKMAPWRIPLFILNVLLVMADNIGDSINIVATFNSNMDPSQVDDISNANSVLRYTSMAIFFTVNYVINFVIAKMVIHSAVTVSDKLRSKALGLYVFLWTSLALSLIGVAVVVVSSFSEISIAIAGVGNCLLAFHFLAEWKYQSILSDILNHPSFSSITE